MKHLSKLMFLTMLIILASCENNEPIDETNQDLQGPQLRFVDGNVVGDGEEDKELMFNEGSEILQVGTNDTRNATGGPALSPETEALVAQLPSQVTVTTTAKPGTDAYFNLTIADATDVLAGTEIPAWCTDVDLSLNNNETLEFDVYSSYDVLPADKFENPENFDKVNWLLNQTVIGEESPNGLGEYTFGHVQYAIWLLIDDVPCQNCVYLTDPIGTWNNDSATNVAKGQELRDLAIANGTGYVPGVGEKLGVVLIPEGKQSVVIGVEVEDLPCGDCVGKVTDLTLQWNWYNDYRVRVYQRYENTCYAVKIFDDVVGLNDEIDLNGANADGSIGRWAYVFVGNCYYTKFRTDCNRNIGPGYTRGVLEVIAGESSHGGELCEYEAPDSHCYW
ncbi:MAG: hypothetical protein ACWA5P_13340 [bacterium]